MSGRLATPALVLWLLLGSGVDVAQAAESSASAANGERWYLLEFAASKPTCEDADANTRCWQTQSNLARFEIRSGEEIRLPSGPAVPPSWAILSDLWAYAPAVAAREFRIAAVATPTGLRITIVDDGAAYLQSLPLNRWVRVTSGTNRPFWARATAY